MTILSVEDFREHVTSDLVDDAIERLLEAAEAAIIRHAGDPDVAVEVFDGGRRFYALDRPAASITSITETWSTTVTTLVANDYFLYPSGLVLERLHTGDHYPHHRARITITYVPQDDEAIRIGVQLDLVALALNSNPGASTEQIGAWMEQHTQGQTTAAEDAYTAILSRLDVGPTMLVIG